MPIVSTASDTATLTFTAIGEYAVSVERLWAAWADPRQLERFWGPPEWPATFTRHDTTGGGRSEYSMCGPDGSSSCGYWRFVKVRAPHEFWPTAAEHAVIERERAEAERERRRAIHRPRSRTRGDARRTRTPAPRVTGDPTAPTAPTNTNATDGISGASRGASARRPASGITSPGRSYGPTQTIDRSWRPQAWTFASPVTWTNSVAP